MKCGQDARGPLNNYATFFRRFFIQPASPATAAPIPAETSVAGSGVWAVPTFGVVQPQYVGFGCVLGTGFTHGSTGGILTGVTGVGTTVIVTGRLIGAMMGGKNASAGDATTPNTAADIAPRITFRSLNMTDPP